MSKWAKLDAANIVIEIFDHETLTPDKTHIPAIAREFIPCPDDVQPMWRFTPPETWSPPQPAEK